MPLEQSWFEARRGLARSLSHFLPKPEAQAESWRWFQEGLGWDRARLHAHGDQPLASEAEALLSAWLDRRQKGEPWAYILGWATWRGRRFQVSPDTLIPRPETEIVLEAALQAAKRLDCRHACDIGTGCGVLGVTLALETVLKVTATDISEKAIEVAKRNARDLGAPIDFACGDLLEPLEAPIELVVSNPPYIDPADAPGLQREISFEPKQALFAPDGGTGVAERLLKQCLDRGARCAVIEIGAGQGAQLKSRAIEMGWQNVEVKQDLAKRDRALIALA